MSFSSDSISLYCKVSSLATKHFFVPTKGWVYKKCHTSKTKGSQCLFQKTLFLFIAYKVTSLATILFFVPTKGWVYTKCHKNKTKGSQCLFQLTLLLFLVKYLSQQLHSSLYLLKGGYIKNVAQVKLMVANVFFSRLNCSSFKVSYLATTLLFVPNKGWVYKKSHTSKTKGSQCLFQQTLFRFLVKYLPQQLHSSLFLLKGGYIKIVTQVKLKAANVFSSRLYCSFL